VVTTVQCDTITMIATRLLTQAHTHQPPASQPSHPQSGPQLKAGRDHSDDDDDDQELVTSDQDPLTLLSSVIPWSPVLRSECHRTEQCLANT